MSNNESPERLDEKELKTDSDPVNAELEHGHLKELEVDVDKVFHDVRQHSIEEDTSPYPEGKYSTVAPHGISIAHL